MENARVMLVQSWAHKLQLVAHMNSQAHSPLIYVCSAAIHCKILCDRLGENDVECVCVTDCQLGARIRTPLTKERCVFVLTLPDLLHYCRTEQISHGIIVFDDFDMLIGYDKSDKIFTSLRLLPEEVDNVVLAYEMTTANALCEWLGTTCADTPAYVPTQTTGEQTLIISPTRSSCWKKANAHAAGAMRLGNDSSICEVLAAFPPYQKRRKCVRSIIAMATKGVGCYHSGMYPFAREIVHELFRAGVLNTVYTTVSKTIGLGLIAPNVRLSAGWAQNVGCRDKDRLQREIGHVPMDTESLDVGEQMAKPSPLRIMTILGEDMQQYDVEQRLRDTFSTHALETASKQLYSRGHIDESFLLLKWHRDKSDATRSLEVLTKSGLAEISDGIVTLTTMGLTVQALQAQYLWTSIGKRPLSDYSAPDLALLLGALACDNHSKQMVTYLETSHIKHLPKFIQVLHHHLESDPAGEPGKLLDYVTTECPDSQADFYSLVRDVGLCCDRILHANCIGKDSKNNLSRLLASVEKLLYGEEN